MALDTDPGIGVGTPIVPGTPGASAIGLYQPPVVTALSLAEYGAIMGLNPIQFMSGSATGLFESTGCSDKWMQYSWQDEARTSRDELAKEIQQAELDIASELGYYPGQEWTENESQPYPKYFKHKYTTASGINLAGYYKSVQLARGKFISAGARSVDLIGQATYAEGTLEFLDEDGDSFAETAKITLATTESSIYNHKVFIADQDGLAEWEVRPVWSKELSGDNIIIRLPIWLLFVPEKLAAFPGSTGFSELDPSVLSNLVDSIDVYYETADPATECTLYWYETDDPSPTTQAAHLQGKYPNIGSVSVLPATYDAVTKAFTIVAFTEYREPDRVEANYLSGDYKQDPIRGMNVVPDDLAKAIVWMATARLNRPLCTACENIMAKEKHLRTDLSFQTRGEGNELHFVSPEVLTCPFGTRVGEVEAWRIVKARIKEGDVVADVALI